MQFTERELDIMQVLWDRGPSVVSEVQAELADKLAYTTVLTMLRTLEAKGYLRHEEEGRGHRYFPTVEQSEARQNALAHITRKLFKGSAELLFTQLVSDRKLSVDEITRMRDLLARQGGKTGEPEDK